MKRTYFVTWWHVCTISSQIRRYSHIFEGEDIQEQEERAKAFAVRKRQQNPRVYFVEVLRFDVETLRPYYVDGNGVGHLSQERTECTRIARYSNR
jgi:hypothetical protein